MQLLRPWLEPERLTWRSSGSRLPASTTRRCCFELKAPALQQEKILSHALQPLEESEDEREEALHARIGTSST